MIGVGYELYLPGKLYVIHKPLPLVNLCENYFDLGNLRLIQGDLLFCLKSEIQFKGTQFQCIETHFLFGAKILIFQFPFTINPNIISLHK